MKIKHCLVVGLTLSWVAVSSVYAAEQETFIEECEAITLPGKYFIEDQLRPPREGDCIAILSDGVSLTFRKGGSIEGSFSKENCSGSGDASCPGRGQTGIAVYAEADWTRPVIIEAPTRNKDSFTKEIANVDTGIYIRGCFSESARIENLNIDNTDTGTHIVACNTLVDNVAVTNSSEGIRLGGDATLSTQDSDFAVTGNIFQNSLIQGADTAIRVSHVRDNLSPRANDNQFSDLTITGSKNNGVLIDGIEGADKVSFLRVLTTDNGEDGVLITPKAGGFKSVVLDAMATCDNAINGLTIEPGVVGVAVLGNILCDNGNMDLEAGSASDSTQSADAVCEQNIFKFNSLHPDKANPPCVSGGTKIEE